MGSWTPAPCVAGGPCFLSRHSAIHGFLCVVRAWRLFVLIALGLQGGPSAVSSVVTRACCQLSRVPRGRPCFQIGSL